ncbi:ciliary neurotrophic factor [Salminus brasiliensis]|uniref:ciliary neurotrophic factor n=1 Tax=Salminus brasiliensis TaxID=930266 RepID=UPI003B82D304
MAGRQGSGGQAGKAAAIARLLHDECTHLLQLYTERESLPSFAAPGGQLVTLPTLGPQLSPAEKLCFLHAALSECRRLLDEAIKREDAEFAPEEDEYRAQRRTVKDRLGHLLLSTERLLVDGKKCAASVAEVPDSVDGGTFALKKWILQVLQDIVHWSSQTSEALQTLPGEKAPRRRRAARRQRGRLRK